MWFCIPFAEFRYVWWLGYLEVVELEESTPAAAVLQTEDVILAVDDELVYPGQEIFPLPKKDSYRLDIQRDGQVIPAVEILYPAEPSVNAVDYR
jgi:hypothetical protein